MSIYEGFGHHRGGFGGLISRASSGGFGGLISRASAGHHRGASGGSEQLIIGGLRGALNGASAGVEGALFPYLGAGGREGEREGGC